MLISMAGSISSEKQVYDMKSIIARTTASYCSGFYKYFAPLELLYNLGVYITFLFPFFYFLELL
jgi:hypothetical protein